MISQKSQVEVDDHTPLAKNDSQLQQITSNQITLCIQSAGLSLDQTSFRGCKRDCSRNSSCH